MKLPLIPLLAAAWIAACPADAADPPSRPPNIVFFLADDLGQRDLACYGDTFYETPALDRLAVEGMRFTDAYAACQVCSPSRAAIMLGQWPQRCGITDYIGAPMKPENWNRNTRLLPATYTDRLPKEPTNLAESLKTAGYATFFAGKWHLGPEGWWPEKQGFDVNMGGHSAGGPYSGNKYFSPYQNPRLEDKGPEGVHLAYRLAEETNAFITANKDRPFLAYYSFYDVHTPLMAIPELREKYAEKRKAQGLETRWGREETRDVRLTRDDPVYAAMVETMDRAVGMVLERIDQLGLRENTIVLFTSDNGGLSTSEGWPTSNVPLRAGKGWIYEGGIRVPLIVRWPGVTQPGTISATPVNGPDYLPTLLAVTGASVPDGQPVDGIDLSPVLRREPVPERPLFWHYPHYGNQGGAPSAAVRLGDWKLIHWFEDDRNELFHLGDDPGETKDLATAQPGKAGELKALLEAWQKDVGARFPAPNPRFDPQRRDGRVAERRNR